MYTVGHKSLRTSIKIFVSDLTIKKTKKMQFVVKLVRRIVGKNEDFNSRMLEKKYVRNDKTSTFSTPRRW